MRRDSGTPFSFLSLVSLWRAGCIVFLRRCSTRRTTMTQAVTLEIVWRNPRPPQRRQRWEQVTRDSATGHYLLQELISTQWDRSGLRHRAWKYFAVVEPPSG